MSCPICQTEDSYLFTCSNSYGRRAQIQCGACRATFLLHLPSINPKEIEMERERIGRTDGVWYTPENYYKNIRSYGNEGDDE